MQITAYFLCYCIFSIYHYSTSFKFDPNFISCFLHNMSLIPLLLIILLSITAQASTYVGKIAKTKSQLFFIDDVNKKPFSLTSSTPIIATYINKLSDGDFISIEGSKNNVQNTITINSVNYIGLSVLLGTWLGEDSYCYHFTSFTEFSISYQEIGKTCLPTSTPSYTYFVNPTTTKWVMLLAGERGSYVGDLTINSPKDVQIELYDSETGDILRHIRLRK